MRILFISVGTVIGVLTAVAIFLARRVIGYRSRANLRIKEITPTTVELPATRQTAAPGEYGIWSEDGYAHLGELISSSSSSVTRQVLSQTGSINALDKVSWTGDVMSAPEQVGSYEDVSIRGNPAWLFEHGSRTWAIHIHALRVTRVNVLRSVAVTNRCGLTSLAVSYRGDGEGLPKPGGSSSLGLEEWKDIEDAIAYARERGAQRVVLIGWSMGATIALLAAENSAHAQFVEGLVLISPPSNWTAVIESNARQKHLPKLCASLAVKLLSTPLLCRTTGIHRPIDFDQLDWCSSPRIRHRTLAIHSPGDERVPFALSKDLVRSNDRYAELLTTESSGHGLEYNVSPETFTSTLSDWLAVTLTRDEDTPNASRR